MKIAVIGSAYPFRGGLASYNERLARELMDRRHEVVIYTFTLQYPSVLFPGKTQLSADPPPAGLQILPRINSVNPLSWIATGREINAWQPDLIICKFWLPFMGPAFGTVLRLAKRSGAHVLSIIDNIIPHEKRPGDRAFARYFCQAVDGFIVMSHSVEEDMRQFVTRQPVRYSPHPVFDNFGDPVSREEGLAALELKGGFRYLLFFGFIRDYKGLDLLLRAMADERVRAMPLRLIVAGEYYGNQVFYESLIDELGIRDRLILHTDFISNEAVKYYFAAADLVVQPYKTATQSGISQTAYHFGTPMVVTKVGGLPEIVPHGKAGYVVEPDPKAVADAIVDFYENDRAAALREGVKEEGKQYQWSHMAALIEQLAKRVEEG